MTEEEIREEIKRQEDLATFCTWQLGWAVVEWKCPMCNSETIFVLPMGALVGCECPKCNREKDFAIVNHGDGVWILADPAQRTMADPIFSRD